MSRLSRLVPFGTVALVLATASIAVAEPFRTHEGGSYHIDGEKYRYEIWQNGNSDYELKVWKDKNYPKGPEEVLSRSRFDSSGNALNAFDCRYTQRILDKDFCKDY